MGMINSITETYTGKTVLITGHTGFKGGWLALWLNKMGANVVGYSLAPPSTPNFFSATQVSEFVKHIHGDITDLSALTNALQEYSPDIVFHLAAQPLVRLSYDEPVSTYETNVMGTVKVMEAIRQSSSVKAFINVTSDKCYENREWHWGYRENDPFGGSDPYSSSKGCAELVFSAYVRSYFSPQAYGTKHHTLCGSVRAGNVIGGGDWGADRLLPDCVCSFSEGKAVTLRYPSATRPWQHVLDPLCGYLALGAKLLQGDVTFSGGWNFGPSDSAAWTVEEVVRKAASTWGKATYTVDAQPHPHEAHWLKLDCSRARQLLDWSPQWDVSQTIEKTIEWYALYYNESSMAQLLEFSLSQIESYEQSTP